MNKLLFLPLFFALQYANAQNMARVYYNIDTLSAPGMHGRGAANDGDKIASNFIKKYFEKFKSKPLVGDTSYFQPFHYNINTFENPIQLTAKKKKYIPGKDYILHPSSGGSSGSFEILKLDTNIFSNTAAANKFFKQRLQRKALVFSSKDGQRLKALPAQFQNILEEIGCMIEIVDKKLTASLSTEQRKKPWVQVLPSFLEKMPSKIVLIIAPILKENFTSQNIVGMVSGTSESDTCLVISAHYDHLGRMGKDVYFPGANDNASGVSMIIELMAFFNRAENKPKYNIVFIAFAAEEAGLIGSHFFVQNPLVPLSKIKFLINLDLLGTGEEGLMVVNGSIHNNQFEKLVKINTTKNYLPAIKKRGKAANSDHYYFSEQGVPAFFFYTLGGVSHYHDIYDLPQTLPLTKYKQVYSLIIDFIKDM